MKKISQKEIEIIKAELAAKRKEFDTLDLSSLEERLTWISKFFNSYVPQLEKRYMSEKEIKKCKLLPNEVRIHFYLYFPEHGLNMANAYNDLEYELEEGRCKSVIRKLVNRFYYD